MRWLSSTVGRLVPRRPFSMAAMVLIVLVTIALDQASKLMAEEWLRGKPHVVLIPGLFNLYYAQNTGAAFSMFENKTGMLALFSTAISMGIFVFAWRLKPEEWPLRLALGLILGGAVGNLIDRVRLNYVIDFFHAHWFWKAHWPIFNIADSAVCVGMALLLLATFLTPSAPPASEPEPPRGK